jgi:hypothetical protein
VREKEGEGATAKEIKDDIFCFLKATKMLRMRSQRHLEFEQHFCFFILFIVLICVLKKAKAMRVYVMHIFQIGST